MCRLETEGTKFGCGHYVCTRRVRKIDCGSPTCMHSSRHPYPCPSCVNAGCDRYYGPDAKETITKYTEDYCDDCEYWYEGPGSRPHPVQDTPIKEQGTANRR